MNGITDTHIVWRAYKNVRVGYPIHTFSWNDQNQLKKILKYYWLVVWTVACLVSVGVCDDGENHTGIEGLQVISNAMRSRCFCYFRKTGSPYHNFFLDKNLLKNITLQILNFILVS